MSKSPITWIKERWKTRKVFPPSSTRLPPEPVHPGPPPALSKGAFTVDLTHPAYSEMTEDDLYYLQKFLN